MQSKITISTFKNPFNLSQKDVDYVDVGTTFVDYLKVKYPDGFKRPTRVLLNGSKLKVSDFDVVLIENDVVEVQIIPQDPVTAAIVVGVVAAGVTAEIVLNNLPEIPSLETPETLSALKKSGGNAYNLREQSNLARLNEPIPTQYGKIQWYPDLAAAPYVRHEDNLPVTRYLLSLGKGSHVIDDIIIGNSSIATLDEVSYTQYSPGQAMTLFNDNVYTIPNINNVTFRSPSRSKRESNLIVFDRTAQTITFPSNQYLTQIFTAGDDIRIYCNADSAVDGVFEIDTVTDTVITLVDASAWTKSSVTEYAAIYLEDDTIENPLSSYTSPGGGSAAWPRYLVKGTYSGVFTFKNPYLKDVTLEFDFEAVDGIGSIHQSGFKESSHDIVAGIVIPIDENGNEVSEYYRIYTRNLEWFTDLGGNAFQIHAAWRHWRNDEDLSDVYFPSATNRNLIFLEDDVVIEESDIANIDYTNGTVTFNTAKTGTIGVKNAIIYYTSTHDLLSRISGESFNLSNTVRTSEYRTTYSKSLFIVPDHYEYNVWPEYKCFILCGRGAQGGYDTFYDDVVLNRVKVRYPDVQDYPAISLLAIELTSTPTQQYTEANNISIVSTRKLLEWNGSAWTGPTASRSISWAIADVWMSTYGASRSTANLDLATLLTLNTLWTSRGDTFDGIFDANITVWEALQKIARVGRCRPIFDGSMLTFVRDGAQSIYTAVFGPNNILPNSFNLDYSFPDNQSSSVVKVKYLDEDNNYTPSEVLSSSNGGKIRDVDFFGCVNYNQAWRESQYLESQLLRQRLSIRFSTEMAGHIPFYGDLISVQYDLPSWGQGGQVVSKSGTTITTNQPLDWTGSAPFYISFMKPDGSLSGPHTVTQGSGDYEAVLDTDVTSFTFIGQGTNQNPTIYQFGPNTNWNKPCVVTKVTPKADNETLDIQCVPYDATIHTADTGTPDTKPSLIPSGNPIPPDIGGLILTNTPGSGSIVVTWNTLSDIDNYKVQKSTDNNSWTDVSTPSVATETIAATGVLYVRVASVIDSIVGDYTKAVIVAS